MCSWIAGHSFELCKCREAFKRTILLGFVNCRHQKPKHGYKIKKGHFLSKKMDIVVGQVMIFLIINQNNNNNNKKKSYFRFCEKSVVLNLTHYFVLTFSQRHLVNLEVFEYIFKCPRLCRFRSNLANS